MKNATKFTFDTHFDAPGEEKPAEIRSRKSYSAEEIDAIRMEARDEGRKDGDVRAAQALAASIGQVAAAIVTALNAMDGEVEAIRAEAAALALAAARKLSGAALSAAPEEEITEVLKAALHQAVGEPRIVVKTTPRLAVAIEAKAATLAADHGFDGRIHFAPDSALGDGDCRIEWRSGGIERAHKTIDDALADLITRRFAGAGSGSEVKE